jgi:hypothetical protein
MEYRHTLEIISKDIQDIEKLLDNFNNYSTIPAIELELALSKLRNIYDLLLLFRESSIEKSRDISKTHTPDKTHKTHDKTDSELHIKYPPYAEDVMSNILAPEDISISSKEIKRNQKSPEDLIDKEDVNRQVPATDQEKSEKIVQKPDDNDSKPPSVKKEKEGVILGEKYNLGKKSLNENLGGEKTPSNIKIKLQGSPISNIAGTIGINDKFYLIRELFKSDAELFRQTLDILDHSQNFNDAFKYLTENFAWDMESEPAQQLLSLIRRKFISYGNE